MQETIKLYPGLSAEQVLDGVAKALVYSGGQEFNIVHSADSVQADRSYLSAFYLVGADTAYDEWLISARDTPAGARAVVSIKRHSATKSASPSGIKKPLSSFTVTTTTGDKSDVGSGPVARLFWARVDFTLGLSKNWVTCFQSTKGLKEDEAQALEPLCAGPAIQQWANNIPDPAAPRCHSAKPIELFDPQKRFLRCISQDEADDIRSGRVEG